MTAGASAAGSGGAATSGRYVLVAHAVAGAGNSTSKVGEQSKISVRL